MTVVKFKPRHKSLVVNDDRTALREVDQALGSEFVRLAERYGAYAVTTVAMKYMAEAVERVRRKHRPTDEAWIRDLAKCFNDAMKRKL